ncbi:MAG: DUF1573 domain-containing protein [Cytophagales bacterium]|nr:DUF1573 domain-containing protein [Cytophagales bacterium]
MHLSKSISVLFLIIFLGCNQQSQQYDATTIEVSSPVDIGDVPLGIAHRFTISIVNTGQNPMQIGDVMVPCTCTVPTWEKAAIDPNENTEISIEFTPGDLGFFQEEIMVTGNFESTYVKLTGNVLLQNY